MSEKQLLKVIAFGQANIIRAMGMQDDNAACRAVGRDPYWNAGHFDELASHVEKTVDAVVHAETSANDKRISDLKTAADSLPPVEVPPERKHHPSIEDVLTYLALAIVVGSFLAWTWMGLR